MKLNYICLKKDAIMNQVIRLTKFLNQMSASASTEEVQISMVGIVTVLGNLRGVILFASND